MKIVVLAYTGTGTMATTTEITLPDKSRSDFSVLRAKWRRYRSTDRTVTIGAHTLKYADIGDIGWR
jgi:hypothetical protein